jgi:hypothetical protein
MIEGYLLSETEFYPLDGDESFEVKYPPSPVESLYPRKAVVGYNKYILGAVIVQNRQEQLESYADLIYHTLKRYFYRKTGDDRAFTEAFINPQTEYNYPAIRCTGIYNNKVVGSSMDFPKDKTTPEEQIKIACIVRDKQLQLKEALDDSGGRSS